MTSELADNRIHQMNVGRSPTGSAAQIPNWPAIVRGELSLTMEAVVGLPHARSVRQSPRSSYPRRCEHRLGPADRSGQDPHRADKAPKSRVVFSASPRAPTGQIHTNLVRAQHHIHYLEQA
jgi:hypothetical protein